MRWSAVRQGLIIVLAFALVLVLNNMWSLYIKSESSNTGNGGKLKTSSRKTLNLKSDWNTMGELLQQMNKTLSRDRNKNKITKSDYQSHMEIKDYDDTYYSALKEHANTDMELNRAGRDGGRPEVIIIQPEKEVEKKEEYEKRRPVVWLVKKSQGQDLVYLRHIRRVLQRLGYTVVESVWFTEWDIAWSWSYPFTGKLKTQFYDLKPHQKVNHFPGVQFTIKTHLVKHSATKAYIPRAFTMPKDKAAFLKYIANNPNIVWVQKSRNHKGVQIVDTKEVNYTDKDTFIQRYVGNPMLVDNRRFDFGLYTVITSIDPLRIYILDEVIFRFCPEDYYPFDANNVRKYVIKGDYTPIWEMPSLKDLYSTLQYRTKDTIDVYFRSKGIDTSQFWRKLHNAVVDLLMADERRMIEYAFTYGSSRNFFELFRVDFVLDDKLNFYVMEVNLSPNLSPLTRPQLKPLFEHVVYNTLKLTGVANYIHTAYEERDDDTRDMVTSNKDITVFPEWCSSETCRQGCKEEICWTCFQCVSIDTRNALKSAYKEHTNKGAFTRVFPPTLDHTAALTWSPQNATKYYRDLNKKNKLIYMWFIGKCQQHVKWCS